MNFQIAPQEGPHVADANQFVIRTRVPKSEMTDQMISARCAAVGLKVGDMLTVQCYNHALTELLHEASYRVCEEHREIKVIQLNDRDTKQVNQVSFVVARYSPWWTSPAGARVEATERELLGSEEGEEFRVQWNPGKKLHQVYRGEELVAENSDKDIALEQAKAA
jgi:hypothetical protein